MFLSSIRYFNDSAKAAAQRNAEVFHDSLQPHIKLCVSSPQEPETTMFAVIQAVYIGPD